MLAAALEAMAAAGFAATAVSPVLTTAPLGPSRRRYANAAAVVETALPPLAALAALKAIERSFGRRRGQRWGERALDLDLVLWSGGVWTDAALTIPHRAFRGRDFVLGPACAVAPHWRDPLTNLTPRQLHARLTRPRPRS